MLKVDMVSCYVTSPYPQPNNPEGQGRQIRYIPKDIFRLWKFLMVNAKGFQVDEEVHSFWVDEEMYSRESNSFGKHRIETVVQVYFRYFKNIEGGRPVIRYFPSEYYHQIMSFFLRNFSQEHIQKDIQRSDGFFVVRL